MSYQSGEKTDIIQQINEPAGSFLQVYSIFSSITAATILAVFLVTLLLFIIDTTLATALDVGEFFLRIYGLIFVCLSFLCEMEWLEAIRQSTIFQNWLFRGLFYTFWGLFTFVLYGDLNIGMFRFGFAVDIISMLLVFEGVIYSVLVRLPIVCCICLLILE